MYVVRRLKFVGLLILALFLAACGSSSSTPEEESSITQIESNITQFNGSEVMEDNITQNNESPLYTLRFIDSPVVNLTYECGDKIARTDSEGNLTCASFPITFSAIGVEIGMLSSMTIDHKVFPQDLIKVDRSITQNTEVQKIASFLQSLDDDGDVSEFIIIQDDANLSQFKDQRKISTKQEPQRLVDMSSKEMFSFLRSRGFSPVELYVAGQNLRRYGLATLAPVAIENNITINEDIVTTISLEGIDNGKKGLTYRIVDSPTHGIFTGRDYIPNRNYFGTDSFTFVVNDGYEDSLPASVNITINSVNDAPILQKNSLTVSFMEHNISNFVQPIKAESADMDGDGDIDIIVGQWDDSNSDTPLQWYENDGNENFVEHNITHIQTNEPQDTWSFNAIDLDNDGDMDIVMSLLSNISVETNTSIRWYENDGSQNFIEHNISTTIFAMAIDIADMDKDGDIDIVATHWWNDDGENSIVWYENDGSQNFTEHNVSTDRSYGGLSVQATDIDKDGDIDILPSLWGDWDDNAFVWYENDGNQNFIEHNISRIEDRYYCYATESIDLDKDGDMDILTTIFDGGSDNGMILWYENDGRQNFTEHNVSQLGDIMDNEIDVQAIDVDNDGDIDVVGGHNWYENNGTQGFIQHNITSEFTTYFSFSDIDGDGDIDMAVPYWESNVVVWQENLGVRTLYISENNRSMETMNAIDVDGDSLTYSILGTDANKFDINGSTGELSFKVAPDHENPTDDDGDNVYELNIAVTDGLEEDSLDILVVVEDVDD